MTTFFFIGDQNKFYEALKMKLKTNIVTPKKEVFSNGELVFFLEGNNYKSEDVVIICNLSGDVNGKIFELLIFLDLLSAEKVKDITLIIPYIPYSRQDRNFGMKQPLTLRLFAELLELKKVDRILTFDMHSPQSQSTFRIPVFNFTALPSLVVKILENRRKENFILCIPDAGSSKRGINISSYLDLPIIFFSKIRTNGKAKSQLITDLNLKGKDIILIDDMIDGGGTLFNCLQELKKKEVNNIYIATTHYLNTKKIYNLEDLGIKSLYTSNSFDLPDNININLNIINLEDILLSELDKIIESNNGDIKNLEDSWFLYMEG